MKQVDLLILTWHQTYMSDRAGGYVRLKEFLKRMPKNISYILLDNSPSIYKKTVKSKNLHEYKTPNLLKLFIKRLFILWYLLENLFAGYSIYRQANKIIKRNHPKIIYLPIAEFLHIYIAALILKLKNPNIKLVIDILNYELPEKNIFTYYKKLREIKISLFRSLAVVLNNSFTTFLLSKTIKNADYIFTVSPELVKKIKKDYKKDSIDFTPSGVNVNKHLRVEKKIYLGTYVGRMTVQKGVFDLIEVWNRIVKKNKNAKLAIVGQVDSQILFLIKEKLKKYNLCNNIDIFVNTSDNEKNKILSQSEIFLHLAKYEPLFPVIGILEGLAHGLPVIVYDMDVLKSQKNNLREYQSINIVKNSNKEAVNKKVLEILSTINKKRSKLEQDARKYIGQYDWDNIAQKEFNVFLKYT